MRRRTAFDTGTALRHPHAQHALRRADPAPRLRPTLVTNCWTRLTPYFVMKVGHVPVIPYHRPGDPAAADLPWPPPSRSYGRGKARRSAP
jgi:hypothetical protein